MATREGVFRDDRGWSFRIDRYINGHRVREVHRPRYPNRQMAQAVFQDRLKDLLTSGPLRPVVDQVLTVEDLVNRWLTEIIQPHREPSTYQTYLYNLRNLNTDPLGRQILAQVRPLDIQQFLGRQLQHCSPANVRRTFDRLRQAFRQAVKWEMIGRDPTVGVEPPRKGRPKRPTITVPEARQLMQVSKEHQFYIVEALALWGGLRRGEILGLQWKDIDWIQRTAIIKRQAVVVNGRRVNKEQPKTEQGYRTVDLPDRLIEALREHQERQWAQRMALRTRWHGQDYIVVQANGYPPNPNWVRSSLKHFRRQTPLAHTTIHDLRHAHATHLLEAGANVKDISDRLGHATIQITLDMYAHVTRGRQQRTAQLVDTLYEGPR